MGTKISMKMDPIARSIGLVIPELSPEGRSKAFAAFARAEARKVDDAHRQRSGKVPKRTTTVDGREGASEESVKPDGGRIEYDWELFGDVFEWIEAQLIINSPVLTGVYQKSHEFTADGQSADPMNPPLDAFEWVFQSAEPYSRKLERMYGLYASVVVMAQKRFGNVLAINFAYRSPLLDYVAFGGQRAGRKAGAAKRSAHNMEKASRLPAIVVRRRG
jgi:hypothetical protein